MSSSNIFKILSIFLTIQGINFIAKSPSLCLILKYSYQIFIISIYLPCIFLSYYNEFISISKKKQGWIDFVNLSGYYGGILFSFIVMQSKRRSLNKFLLELSNSYYFQVVFLKKPNVIFILTLLTVSLPYAISIYENLYNRENWFGSFAMPQQIVVCSIWIFVIDPINYFCVFLNIFICSIFTFMFEQFKTHLKNVLSGDLDHSTWAQLTKEFITQHKILSKLVLNYNSVYANIYLIRFVLDITILVFLIRILNVNRDFNEWTFSAIPIICKYSCIFLLQILSVARVNSQVLSSIHLMQPQLLILSNHYEKTNPYTLFANSELSLYIQQVSLNPAAITAGNFFIINKGTLLSVGATVLTYILVLYGNGQ